MALSAGCGWGRRSSDLDGSYEYVKQAVSDRPQRVVLQVCSFADNKTALFIKKTIQSNTSKATKLFTIEQYSWVLVVELASFHHSSA